jgi:hypothetical protein
MARRLTPRGVGSGEALLGVGLLLIAYALPPELLPKLVAGVLGVALLIVGIRTISKAEAQATPPPTSPAIFSPVDPAPSKATKAAIQSIANQISPAETRVFIPPSATPLFLTGFFEGHTSAQGEQSVSPYLGKWMRIQGPVGEVYTSDTYVDVVTYPDTAKGSASVLFITIRMRFSKEWHERVVLLSPDDEVAVVGRIENIGRLRIDLRDCELVAL